ncbi:MAG: hypothetical protein IKJ08_09055, partial [Alistipes sp.]|nr:hypothetical protein [Alistipes sp.]
LQVIKRIIPPMGNEIITLVKDTSLVRVISVYELMWNGQNFIKSEGITLKNFQIFYAGNFVYWKIYFTFAKISNGK